MTKKMGKLHGMKCLFFYIQLLIVIYWGLTKQKII